MQWLGNVTTPTKLQSCDTSVNNFSPSTQSAHLLQINWSAQLQAFIPRQRSCTCCRPPLVRVSRATLGHKVQRLALEDAAKFMNMGCLLSSSNAKDVVRDKLIRRDDFDMRSHVFARHLHNVAKLSLKLFVESFVGGRPVHHTNRLIAGNEAGKVRQIFQCFGAG